jgi:hypothetical protein
MNGEYWVVGILVNRLVEIDLVFNFDTIRKLGFSN